MRWIARIAGGFALAVATFATVFVVGMRTKCPPLLRAVRRFNRAVTNPLVLRSAGSPGAGASVIRHTGRTSGLSYETPVGPFATDDGYVIALPYGPNVDWARNVVASGSATLVHEGAEVAISAPEIVPTVDVLVHLPPSEQRTLRLFGVDECLLVRSAAKSRLSHRPQEGVLR